MEDFLNDMLSIYKSMVTGDNANPYDAENILELFQLLTCVRPNFIMKDNERIYVYSVITDILG